MTSFAFARTAPIPTPVRLVAVMCLVLGGCESGPPIAEIGTGTTHFEPLEDGQSVPLIAGAQGGWHLWIAVRARGVEPSGVRVDVVSYPLEAERPRQTTFHTLELVPHDGWLERAGLVQVLSSPECFSDREVVVSIDATDVAGRAAHDERVVVPHAGMPIGACAP